MEQPTVNLFELQIDGQSHNYLSDAARWGKFLAIVGFIMCGLIVLAGLFAGSLIALAFNGFQFPGGSGGISAVFTVFFLLIALLYFFPCLYLFRFSSKMQSALRTNDQVQLNASFKNLKSCMRYIGILTIIVMAFYILGIAINILVLGFR